MVQRVQPAVAGLGAPGLQALAVGQRIGAKDIETGQVDRQRHGPQYRRAVPGRDGSVPPRDAGSGAWRAVSEARRCTGAAARALRSGGAGRHGARQRVRAGTGVRTHDGDLTMHTPAPDVLSQPWRDRLVGPQGWQPAHGGTVAVDEPATGAVLTQLGLTET